MSLWRANLSGADLSETEFDEKTVVPNARWIGNDDEGNAIYDKYWTPSTDRSRYTDPKHPNYWQPNWSAAGFDTRDEWLDAGYPKPWLEAGYDDWNEWVRAGKPTSRDESPPDA